MTTDKRTPTPYEVSINKAAGWYGVFCEDDPHRHRPVAVCHADHAKTEEEAEANARFIVQACNRDHLFEDMKAELRACFELFCQDADCRYDDDIDRIDDLLTRIESEREE